ncbi:sugar phosphate isomerase/epimerase family protein [Dactylosporangium sp. NPDC005572]|uniref:sugar phosphate isomerase/epimerase family protein n=1 Tax=Dactylosporangium sp. NPDC005572 TaxID=3156889 RepID=UPI0033B06C31
MKFSAFTASTPDWTPSEAVRILAAQGYDGVEWRVTDQDDAPVPGFWAGNRATWPLTGLEAQLPSIAAITRDAGLEISGIAGYARSYERDDVARLIAATSALRAGRLRVAMPLLRSGHYRDLFADARKDLAWAASLALDHGVTILVELHHETITSSASAALRLIEDLDPATVGVIHDLGNLVIEGYEDHRAAFEMLGPYLHHVHVKNVAWHPSPPSPDGVVTWRPDWSPLREGQADVAAYLRLLREVGYDSWITLEDFSTAVPLEERTADNLAYLRSVLS